MSHWTVDGCPSEDLVAGFVEGSLEADERDAIEAHLDSCKPCRAVVADLVRLFAGTNLATMPSQVSVSADGGGNDPDAVAIGDTVGRYRVLEVLGMGGMGIVYLAHDPELDRKVALKVIRKRGRDQADQSARLVREARAMAKLSHPNVIAVHDVGTWNGQVFVAMEFAGGGTLKGWIAQAERTWATLAPTLVAAGRGLAAAHEAGLVHRDFKPDNVLLSDKGRAFVTDFGLARWGSVASGQAADGPTLDGDDPATVDDHGALTRSGAFVGTPAYMAPEQFKGSKVGPAADQFAYCVVVWEALFGKRPFEGRSVAALAHAVCETPTPDIPPTPALPRRVRHALERGLAKRAEDRFASMQALLEAIGPVGRHRAPWIIAGALGAVAVPLGVMALRTPEALPQAADCSRLAGLSEVWNADVSDAVHRAFVATEVRGAESAVRTVQVRLDAYADTWAQGERAVCEASATGSLDPQRTDLRRRCLDRAQIVVSRVIAGLIDADTAIVRTASKAVVGLPSLAACSNDAQLSAEQPPAPPEGIAPRVAKVRDALIAADGDRRVGRADAGLVRVEAQVSEAEALDFRPLLAEVAYARGRMLTRLVREVEAEAAFEDAELHGTASRYPTVVAKALILRLYAMGRQRAPWDEVDPVFRRAEAAVDGAALPDPIRGTLYANASIAAFYAGQGRRAVELAERAVALTDPDVDPLRWSSAVQTLITAERYIGESERVIPRLQQVIEVTRRELGDLHPELVSSYRELANAYRSIERYDDARIAANKGLALIEAVHGPDHFEYGGTLSTLSSIEGAAENFTTALDLAQRSIAVLETHEVPTQIPRGQKVEWLIALGRMDEAEPILDALIAEETQARGSGPNVSWMHFIRCALESARQDVPATRAACDEAIATSGVDAQDTLALEMHLDRAEYIARAGSPAEAVKDLQALEAMAARAEASSTTARFYATLARRVAEDPSKLSDAQRFMQTAHDQYAGLELEESAAEAESWLKSHEG